MIHGKIKTELSRAEQRIEIIDIVLGFLFYLALLYGEHLFASGSFQQLSLVAKLCLQPLMLIFPAIPAALILVFRRDKLKTLNIEWGTLSVQILVGTLLAIAVSFVLTFIPHLFGYGSWVGGSGKHQPFWYIAYYLFICVFFIGLCEEFAFRCFFYEKAKRVFNTDTAAIVLSSLLFGLMHGFSGGGVAQVIITGLIGAVFALLRLKLPRCTIVSLIVLHGVYDWLICVWSNVF